MVKSIEFQRNFLNLNILQLTPAVSLGSQTLVIIILQSLLWLEVLCQLNDTGFEHLALKSMVDEKAVCLV